MKETYFDIDKIEVINLYDKKESNWKFFPERQKKTIFFGLIIIEDYKPEGYYEYSYDYWAGSNVRTEDFLKNEFGYLIEDKKVYSHPYIVINLASGGYIKEQYNSYKEAKDYIESLIKKTNKNFQIIEYK